MLEIGRANRPDIYNLYYQKPKPFVDRYLRVEVPERLNYKGEVLEFAGHAGTAPRSPPACG